MEAIVIGVGMAGATTAISLTKLGIKCTVYESTKELKPVGASVTIGSNGLRMIDKYIDSELFQELYQKGNHIDCMSMINRRNENLVSRNLGLESYYGYRIVAFQRPILQTILVEKLQRLNVKIEYGKRLKDFVEENNRVKVTFEDGSVAEGDFVISCDGIHSRAREIMFGSDTENVTGLTAIVGISKSIDWGSPDYKTVLKKNSFYLVSDKKLHLVCIPQTENKVFWAYGFKDNSEKKGWRQIDIHKDAPDFVSELKENWPGSVVKNLIFDTEKCMAVTLNDINPLSKWHKGRIALLGDSAHAITPHMGQGLNMAFEDVAQLTESFKKRLLTEKDKKLSPKQLEEIFLEYERERIPRTTYILKETRKNTRNSVPNNRFLEFIYTLIVRLTIFILGPRMFKSTFHFDLK